MTKFLVLLQAWMAWSQKAEGSIVDFGAPLDAPSTIGGGGNDQATSFSILQADSKEAVDQLLRDHPHLHTPGGTIVAHEFLPVPGM